MRSLILFGDRAYRFDPSTFASIFRTTSGVDGFVNDGSDFCAAKFHYLFEDDRTIVRLSNDFKAIEIAGTGKASQRIAWIIQEKIPQPLHITDTNYSTDFIVQACSSFEEFSDLLKHT